MMYSPPPTWKVPHWLQSVTSPPPPETVITFAFDVASVCCAAYV